MSAAVPTQPHDLPLLATEASTSGNTYIVTGANTGLGYEAALHLVRLGAKKVILAVRSLAAGEAAKAKIEAATGTTGVAEVWALDLSSYDSAKAFARRAVNQLERIDAVIENAAVATVGEKRAEGHLLPLTVNVLGTFLLAVLLLPKMRRDAEREGIVPRLVVVSSTVGWDAREEWDGIREDALVRFDLLDSGNLMVTYALSKLMDTFCVRELARVLPVQKGKVVINAVCPGLCITDLGRNCPPDLKESIDEQREMYGRTAEDGSRTLLAAVVHGEESHGCFSSSCEIREDVVPDWVKDEEAQKYQKQLWELVVRELENVEPGCVKMTLQ
ncbi:hypothetical protein BJX61DRAFT_179356 [Aspergillus egyptiacus]|nr:hypothetical protein BJX61DRAFT_179356 [Aspergillus egyptiacus]